MICYIGTRLCIYNKNYNQLTRLQKELFTTQCNREAAECNMSRVGSAKDQYFCFDSFVLVIAEPWTQMCKSVFSL